MSYNNRIIDHLKIVRQTLISYNMIEFGERVILAVSGGPDSVALTNIMLKLKDEFGCAFAIAHLDHGLRVESESEFKFVEGFAESLGINFFGKRVDVAEIAKQKKLSIEHAGRIVRYNFLENTRIKFGAKKIATAHNADDVIETLLFRFFKGTSLRGLSSIPFKRGAIIRPLLKLSKSEIIEFLNVEKTPYMIDRTNTNHETDRNFIRNRIIPVVRERFPNYRFPILRTIDLIREDEQYLDNTAHQFYNETISKVGDSVEIDVAKMNSLPVTISSRIVRDVLFDLSGANTRWTRFHIDRILSALKRPKPYIRLNLPYDLFFVKDYGSARLSKFEELSCFSYCVRVSEPGRFKIPESKNYLDFNLLEGSIIYPNDIRADKVYFDADSISFPFFLRTFKPGDRIICWGKKSPVKLKKLFIDAKIPRGDRSRLPLVLKEDYIIWAPGIERCAGYAVGPNTKKTLEISFLRGIRDIKKRCLAFFFIALITLTLLPRMSNASGLRGEPPWKDYDDDAVILDTDSYSDGYLSDFFRALNLVEKHFVQDLSEDTILKNAIQKLVFITPPYCQDNLVSIQNCPYDVRHCFSDSIMIVSTHCGYDPDQLSTKAMDMLLRDIDPYSSTLDSAMINELKITASGKFAGVGMVVGFRDGEYVVISPFDGSPAYRAGIRAGDQLLEIDGVSLHGLSLFEALKRVRGPSGSEVKFKVRDPLTQKIHDVRLRRTLIQAPSVRSRLLSDNVGYLRLVNFQKDTREEALKAINKMKSSAHSTLRGLILDLRDNPGGLFSEAIKVSDLFLKSGAITSLKSRGPKLNKEFFATGYAPFASLPIIVLINRGTASASEILAGALQKRQNTLILGSRSFGKASVQDIFPIRPGLAIKLTTAHYYTANGRDIDGSGIQPDVLVSMKSDQNRDRSPSMDLSRIGNDESIKIALQYLTSSKSGYSSNIFMNLF